MDPNAQHGTPALSEGSSSLCTADWASPDDQSPISPGTSVSPNYHRRSFSHLGPVIEEDTAYPGAEIGETSPDLTVDHGLGIKYMKSLPGSANLLLSPTWSSSAKKASKDRRSIDISTEDTIELYPSQDSNSSLHRPFVADSDTESLREADEPRGVPQDLECRFKGNLSHNRSISLSLTIISLSIYSTLFSFIWLFLALKKPRYGHLISTTGLLLPETASLITTAFAKSIELSFVTVFVAFVGQALSRRALLVKRGGITIAEMSMRSWVLQPGTMLTHWQTLRYAAITFLGVLALMATIIAMLYTTASDALVAPKLKFGEREHRSIYGKISTVFANRERIDSHCTTPVPQAVDPEYRGSTCIQIEYSGQAYHNYMQYLGSWSQHIAQNNGSDELAKRPGPIAMLYDNTTVIGSWLPAEEMAQLSRKYSDSHFSRVVHNVTAAMPHAGVFAAARDPTNNILQPQDFKGLGEYEMIASVPSPTVNVLCASMEEEELAPMVFSLWPGSNGSDTKISGWPLKVDIPVYPDWLNRTAVDDLFGFGPKYGRRHPVFPKLPIEYNSVLNGSGAFIDSIYLLTTSADKTYMLCSLRGSLTKDCSTQYNASMSGGVLSAHCSKEDEAFSYGKSEPSATNGVINSDWANVATGWALALSLNAGIEDGNASNARMLSQFIPSKPALEPSLPSIAEALAVLSGCTLLISTIDAPFKHFWNYSSTTLAEPQLQSFAAMVRTQDYSSGGTDRWQNVFHPVLFWTFGLNLICLIYMLPKRMITDFTDPQNMFLLSLNSSASQALEGACGRGPEKEQLGLSWFIKCDAERYHFFIHEGKRKVSKKSRLRLKEIDLSRCLIVRIFKSLFKKF